MLQTIHRDWQDRRPPARQHLPGAPSGSAVPTAAAPGATNKVTAYTLPPDLYKKARDRSRINFRLALIGFVYGLVVLWLILYWKLGAKYRDWAEKFSGQRFLQSARIFSSCCFLPSRSLLCPWIFMAKWIEKQYGTFGARMGFVELGLDQSE